MLKLLLKLKIEEETALNTYRVSAHPKRLKIKGRTQTLYSRFSTIGSIKNLTYVQVLLEGLEGLVNSL